MYRSVFFNTLRAYADKSTDSRAGDCLSYKDKQIVVYTCQSHGEFVIPSITNEMISTVKTGSVYLFNKPNVAMR